MIFEIILGSSQKREITLATCTECHEEYSNRRADLGYTTCLDCGESTARYTGVMIYTHKTAPDIQINADPALTQYLINSTKLKNKGGNLGENLKVSGNTRGSGRCLTTVGDNNAKGKL